MALKLKRLVEEDEMEEGKHPLAPKQPFRMIVIGASNSGKTSFVLSLILQYLIVDFLAVFAKYDGTPLYEAFKKQVKEKGEFEAKFFNSVSDLELLEEFNPKAKNVILFDDMMNEDKKDKDRIGDFYTAGRHKGISVISIFHGYKSGCPKFARAQASHLALCRGVNDSDLKQIYVDFPISELGSYEAFKSLYSKFVKHPGEFLLIDFYARNPPFTKFRLGFSRFYDPSTRSFCLEPKTLKDIPKIIRYLAEKNHQDGLGLPNFGLPADQLDILIGEIKAGNNSPIVKREFFTLLKAKVKAGEMTKKKANELIEFIE